jgi:S1-C subfamily serine protease
MQPIGARPVHASVSGKSGHAVIRQAAPSRDTVQFSGWFGRKKPEPPQVPLTVSDLEKRLNKQERSIRSLQRSRLYLEILIFGFLGYTGSQILVSQMNPRGPQGFVQGSMSAQQLQKREALGPVLERSAQRLDVESIHFINLRNFVNPATVMISERASALTGVGSGWVYREDGIIVTNQHVAEIANKGLLAVTLYDGTPVQGRVIGVDRRHDVAVIKVDLHNLPVLGLRSHPARPGELVMAVGHPHKIGWSSSVGTISGDDRTVNRDFPPHLLQTDASIAPGNSGGPLVDMRGRVVGMNQSGMEGMGELGFSVNAAAIERSVQRILREAGLDR